MSNDFWKGYLTAALVSLLMIFLVGNIARCETIEEIITKEALSQDFDPRVALAIAKIESSLRPGVVGPKGEIGLFQIRPQFASVPRIALFNPYINTKIGIGMLKKFKKYCYAQADLTYVVCYNNGFRKPKYPTLHPYYKRFIVMWASE